MGSKAVISLLAVADPPRTGIHNSIPELYTLVSLTFKAIWHDKRAAISPATRVHITQLGDSTKSDHVKKQYSLHRLLHARLGQDAALAAARALGAQQWRGRPPAGIGQTALDAAGKAALQSLAVFNFLRPLLEVPRCPFCWSSCISPFRKPLCRRFYAAAQSSSAPVFLAATIIALRQLLEACC